MARRKKSDSSNNEAKDTFKWTDNESELLLKVTRNYKVSKAAEGTDWKSIHSKYADILQLLLAQYLETPEAAKDFNKDYPHKKLR